MQFETQSRSGIQTKAMNYEWSYCGCYLWHVRAQTVKNHLSTNTCFLKSGFCRIIKGISVCVVRQKATLEVGDASYKGRLIGTDPQTRRAEKFHSPVSKWLKAAEEITPARRSAEETVQESMVGLKSLDWLSGEVQPRGQMRRPAGCWLTDCPGVCVKESLFGRR